MPTDRFVVDTNVLVSAFVFRSEKPHKALLKSTTAGIITVSEDVLKEYREILLSTKFDAYVTEIIREAILAAFIEICEHINPTEKIFVCRDPKDNMFLELAVAGKAKCIITGDPDLLTLNPFEDIPILSPNEFLDRF